MLKTSIFALVLISLPAHAIVNGLDATGAEDFVSSTVGLIAMTDGKWDGGCTASLLSGHFAITAAHCIKNGKKMFIAFGLNKKSVTPQDLREVVGSRHLPNWVPGADEDAKNTGDLAVVMFSGGLPSGYKGADVLQNARVLKNGSHILIAGFGTSFSDGDKSKDTGGGVLRSADVTILNARYSETELTVRRFEGRGPCHGDSGGPAFVRTPSGELLLWGVTSGGTDGDKSSLCQGPSKFTSIPAYAAWIKTAEAELETFTPN